MTKQEYVYNLLGIIAAVIVAACLVGVAMYSLRYFTSFKKDITMNDIKIETLVEGTGTPAKIGDDVLVNYKGTLADGREFDSSYRPGREPFPVTIGAGQVIKGWEVGLQGIKVGEKRKLTIPPSMGYGAQEVGGGLIPANSTLIFEVEAMEIHPHA